MRTFIPLASLLLLASVGHAQSGWIYNPATKHWYQLAPASSWQDAENYAQSLNGHLVSIEDMHEDRWLYNNFGVLGAFWTGFNDIAHESRWVWSSGDFITHTNWAPNQPDKIGRATSELQSRRNLVCRLLLEKKKKKTKKEKK